MDLQLVDGGVSHTRVWGFQTPQEVASYSSSTTPNPGYSGFTAWARQTTGLVCLHSFCQLDLDAGRAGEDERGLLFQNPCLC